MTFQFKEKYGNYIGGKFVDPVDGKYFDNITPVNGKVLCQIPRSNEKDINLALDAAHAAKDAWGATSVTEAQPNLAQYRAGDGR
jgi:aldehyde dehydrogenase